MKVGSRKMSVAGFAIAGATILLVGRSASAQVDAATAEDPECGMAWSMVNYDSSLGETHLYSVASSDTRFVGVGYGGYLLTSEDGVRWTERSPLPVHTYAIDYSPDLRLFVAAGHGGGLWSSPDGISWTARTSGSSLDLWGVGYGNGTFVVVGYSGTVLTSTDGIKWTSRGPLTNYHLYDVAYGNGRFTVVGNGQVYTSDDSGNTWKKRTIDSKMGLMSVTWGDYGWVAGGLDSTDDGFWDAVILTSPDAVNWTRQTIPKLTTAASVVWDLKYTGEVYLGVGTRQVSENSGLILVSEDGVNWVDTYVTGSNELRGLASRVSASGTEIVAAGFVATCLYTECGYGTSAGCSPEESGSGAASGFAPSLAVFTFLLARLNRRRRQLCSLA